MRLTQTVRVLIGLATTVAMLSGGTAATFASSSQDGAVAHSRDAATSREDVHAHPPRHHRHRAATTVDVVIHDAAHNVITAAPVGTSVHASATVSGAAGTPTGTIDFTWYASPDCSTAPVPAGTGLPLVSGVVDPSDAQTAPVGGGSYEA